MPLNGTIELKVSEETDLVSQGECAIILSGQRHAFCAEESARFMVVDCDLLPENILKFKLSKIAINHSLLSYVQFIDKQLAQSVNEIIELQMFDLFISLLKQQSCSNKRDKRIEKVVALISEDLSQVFTNERLAKQACLSPTQFKKIFKECFGVSPQLYICQQRMEKAKTLLSYTDTPISIIAEQVGYQNPSAFSRKFKQYFGDNPKAF